MRISGTILNHVLLLVFLFTAPSTAEINTLKIRSDDRPMILFQKFGFTHSGTVSVAISSVSLTSTSSQTDPNPSRLIGFFLIYDGLLTELLLELQQNPSFCVVDSKFIQLLFTFRDLSPPPQSSFNKSYPVTYPGEYSLFFSNCNPETLVTMDVRTELYNTDNAITRNYLSSGLTQLPSIYFIFSLIYLCFLALWISVCFKNQISFHRVHLLMGGLLVIKTLHLISAAADNHYVKVTGTPHGWNILFYIFQFINVLLLFTVIVLMGTGSSFLKQEKKKMVLMIVIPLQVFANVVSTVIMETGPFMKDWVTLNQVFLLVDFISCCVIIFPIVTSIRTLRETCKIDGKAAKYLTKLTLFRGLVIGYLFYTRIVVFAQKTSVDYKYEWVSNAAEEVASLVFYMAMFYMFRPVEEKMNTLLDSVSVQTSSDH